MIKYGRWLVNAETAAFWRANPQFNLDAPFLPWVGKEPPRRLDAIDWRFYFRGGGE